MSNSNLDVLVVGAGPVGLTAAAALTHHGLKCRIVDKAPAPSDKSKALAIWCRSLELLDGLGLAEPIVHAGLKLCGGSMYVNGVPVIHLELTSDESPFGFPLMLPQNDTERILTEHLARVGVAVERPVELVSFEEGGDRVACTLRHADGHEERVEASWLVGCDGAHSTVRHVLGLEFTGHAEPNDWMLADVHLDGPIARDEVSVFWHEKGVVAFFPIGRGRFRVIADQGPAGSAPPKELTLAEVQAAVDERAPANLTLSGPIWLANFRINERKVADYRRGRVLLAGDAAHIHSPAGGQGMNTGMQDAFNLAWKLAFIRKGLGQAEPLLDSYSVERSAVGDQVLKNAERFTALATLRNPATRWLRDHVAPFLGSFQFVRDRIRDDWFELTIDYRHSPLSAQRWPWFTGALEAGDRMCDAPLTVSDGRRTTLFAEIRGASRHALLLLPGSPDRAEEMRAIAAAVEAAFPGAVAPCLITGAGEVVPSASGMPVWQDADGRLQKRLHADRPTLFLVRPDGYVGYRCQPADGEALVGYLGRHLVRKGS